MAGGFLTGLGQGLQGASGALSDFMARQRQNKLFEEQKRMNDSRLKIEAIAAQRGQIEVNDLPRQQASDRVIKAIATFGSKAFEDPQFQTDMNVALMPSVKSAPQPLLDQEAKLHSDTQLAGSNAQIGGAKANILTQFMGNGPDGKSQPGAGADFAQNLAGLDPIQRTRMILGIAGVEVPKTYGEIGKEVTTRENASLPFDVKKINLQNANMLGRPRWLASGPDWRPVTGAQGLQMGQDGTTIPLGDTSQMRQQDFNKERIRPFVKRVTELSQLINTKAGLRAKFDGTFRSLRAWANEDDDVGEYVSMVDAFTPQLARAEGHTGTLTEMDFQHAMKILPSIGDSVTLAPRKLKNLNMILYGEEATATTPQPKAGNTIVPGQHNAPKYNGPVKMKAPGSNETMMVPPDQVEHFLSLGASVVR